MYKIFCFTIFFWSLQLHFFAQNLASQLGFQEKVSGDELNYFSPMHEFAPTALLTRANGKMPIVFRANRYTGSEHSCTYHFLMGHSTGTSTGDRNFDLFVNDTLLLTIQTHAHQTGNFKLAGTSKNGASYQFLNDVFDANMDGFGELQVTLPAKYVKEKAVFRIVGQNQESTDWLMIFMYHKKFDIIAQASNLITKKEGKRQLLLKICNPFDKNTPFRFTSKYGNYKSVLKPGYNVLRLPFYDKHTIGRDELIFSLEGAEKMQKSIDLKETQKLTFNIIHHSHNDIGYSHVQTQVEVIQNDNIRVAIEWIRRNQMVNKKAIWHIESLWAVENFLKNATKEEESNFVSCVKSGDLVLSANYANILTGLCRTEELNWALEYAKILEKKYGFTIQNAMITDIPGVTYGGFASFVNNGIPYLCLGPNYIENFPGHGDRVGGVIQEQGDQAFYWKKNLADEKKLLVWTGGKGYSFFHSVADDIKLISWEEKLSNYMSELVSKNYPYEFVQLHYTKKSDNGPVDTNLVNFVELWNNTYEFPTLEISSVDELFRKFEIKYKDQIPTLTGEISPYWEDGAYSTAKEELAIRKLVPQIVALEKFAHATNHFEENAKHFYTLHRNVVMFHEHTWGSWCSISDPESDFTNEQWRYKKAFLDSAEMEYDKLSKKVGFTFQKVEESKTYFLKISDFELNANGGLKKLMIDGKNFVDEKIEYGLFEGIYSLGLNPINQNRLREISIKEDVNDLKHKRTIVTGSFPSIPNFVCVYDLNKETNQLSIEYKLSKEEERKEKEAFHVALPFNLDNARLWYGDSDRAVQHGKDQLKGSNFEFVCIQDQFVLANDQYKIHMTSPTINLVEVGQPIDENRTNGFKVWKQEPNSGVNQLYLYVLNNYWHTNFKAYQSGEIQFKLVLGVEKNK